MEAFLQFVGAALVVGSVWVAVLWYFGVYVPRQNRRKAVRKLAREILQGEFRPGTVEELK